MILDIRDDSEIRDDYIFNFMYFEKRILLCSNKPTG